MENTLIPNRFPFYVCVSLGFFTKEKTFRNTFDLIKHIDSLKSLKQGKVLPNNCLSETEPKIWTVMVSERCPIL